MPYTASQLTSAFTVDNGGLGPDAVTSAVISAYAQQDAAGTISDIQALRLTLEYAQPTTPGYNTPSSTMDVALATYEYVAGTIPSAAGLNYLLTNPGTGLETSYYAGFNQEARYENMMINLAATSASAYSSAFAATYGSMSFAQAVAFAYNKIVGNANVGTAQANAAVADITARLPFFQALAAQAPGANVTLATDAAMMGYILNEAVKADVGTYAAGLDNFNYNLATGGAVNYGTDITASYSSTSPYGASGVVGVSSASGTINAATLGQNVSGISFLNNATGAVTITNAPTNFTLNEAGFDNGQSVTLNQAASGVSDTLNFTATSSAGAHTINGYETVNYSSAVASAMGPLTLNASATGSETLNISGAGAISFASVTMSGASTMINDTATGTLTLGPVSAATINAANSGGLFMTAPDTLVTGGVTGDTIIGASAHANTLYGSVGNDTITAGTLGGDRIVTSGGGDTINLGAGHATDTIYIGSFTGATPTATGAGAITSGADVAQTGYFGAGQGTTANLAAQAESGTSLDQSTISNFKAGVAGDVLVFSKQEWGVGANSNGLTGGDGATAAANGNASISTAGAGATLSGSGDLVELNGQTFANASAVATALKSTYGLTLGGALANGAGAHVLVAYQDASGNAHIADVDFYNGSGASTNLSTSLTEHVSDLVQLTGVSMASLTANNVLFVS